MKQFNVDPSQEQRIRFEGALDFIEYCNISRYAILGIEVGVFKSDPLEISILDNSNVKGETYVEHMRNCNRIAMEFMQHHKKYNTHTFVFSLMTEQRFYEHRT